jgi:O-antigen/teichoic acid export membrane protein
MKSIRQVFSNADGRSARATKHILISLIAKGISILCSLLVVPMTIDYVNPSQYGIWLTISSIIGWIAFFDLGLGNGFRNKFAEAMARGDLHLARAYVSTTYFSLSIIVSFLILAILVVNRFMDWPAVLHVDSTLEGELRQVFAILSVFFCVNLVANTFAMLLTANQQPGYASMINCCGQIGSLAVIFILTKTTEGSLLNLSLFFAGIPCTVMLISSVIAFCGTSYRQFSPALRWIRLPLIKSILGKGVQFFIIYICLILIFQVSNVVLSREIGPLSVTQYNIANKYFNILYMVMVIIITPFWSAFTDAYTRRDFDWMIRTVSKLEKIWLLSVLAALLMLAVSSWFYRVWVKDSVNVPFTLSVCMAIFVLSRSIGDIYMYAINGIGTIRIQLITYVVFAVIAWPCLVWSCRLIGIYGVVLFPSFVYIVQAILGKIQLQKLTSGLAGGLWEK